ncbi:hypothetical protein [Limoniibacter endophyticus]|uniref:Galactose mutarotase-like enzyme n=1 Tax=Limoniibacter endophyticus TaxID=1565040 RepID=A0A8J3DGY4_9HYPH|nr:hypothetical protein [Limoniibacter endophyticus]GHC70583.1 hypothetical protein GCM10010136_17030 [Limoniibacter endophyticus]
MTVSGTVHRLLWDRGEASVFSLGAMLHHARFVLEDGRSVTPLAEAPWKDDAEVQADATIPAHLRQLGGEWACVPFGKSTVDPVVHGFGTDNFWQIIAADEKHVKLAISYPKTHPIEKLERTLSVRDGEAAISLSLKVFPRRDCAFGIGLHPVFVLPEAPERIQLHGTFEEALTFPVTFEEGVSKLLPGRATRSLETLPLADGTTTDFATLATSLTEEAIQLVGAGGVLSVRYPDRRMQATLEWDASALPEVLLWVSAQGRTKPPWGGRFRGLGVEPMKLRFGANGIPRNSDDEAVHHFVAGCPWSTSYRISASILETKE